MAEKEQLQWFERRREGKDDRTGRRTIIIHHITICIFYIGK